LIKACANELFGVFDQETNGVKTDFVSELKRLEGLWKGRGVNFSDVVKMDMADHGGDGNGEKLLHYLSKRGNIDVLEYVWDRDKALFWDTVDNDGNTVIHQIKQNQRCLPINNFEWFLVKSFEQAEQNLFEKVNFNNETVVHIFARHCNVPYLDILWKKCSEKRGAGAFEELFWKKNGSNQLPTDIAAENGQLEVLDFFYKVMGKGILDTDIDRQPFYKLSERSREWMDIKMLYPISGPEKSEASILCNIERICDLLEMHEVVPSLKSIVGSVVHSKHLKVLEWMYKFDYNILRETLPTLLENIGSEVLSWLNLSIAIEKADFPAMIRILTIGIPTFSTSPHLCSCSFEYEAFLESFKECLKQYNNQHKMLHRLQNPLQGLEN
jgi:hypothetical protein